VDQADETDLIVCRELSAAGKNRVFINGQLVTQGFLKRVGSYLVDIHGQGEQAGLYDVESHIGMLDEYSEVDASKAEVADAFHNWSAVRSQIASLEKDTAEKLQMLDILRFQVGEIQAADLQPDEETALEEEKRRLSNVEKLTSLSGEAFALLPMVRRALPQARFPFERPAVLGSIAATTVAARALRRPLIRVDVPNTTVGF